MLNNTPQFPTKIDLSTDARKSVAERLNIHLASTLDLVSQVKQAHWTLKGPQFFARHELFDKVASHLRAQADDTAERISTIGHYPRGTIRMAAETSIVAAFDPGHVSGAQLIRDLIERLGTHAAVTREMLGHLEAQDPASADLLTSQLREIEFDLWFFESHFNA